VQTDDGGARRVGDTARREIDFYYDACQMKYLLSSALLAGRGASEARVAAGVSAFLSASSAAQADELRTLYTAHLQGSSVGLASHLSRASTASPDALKFLRAVRARCADMRDAASMPAWITETDKAAMAVLSPLYGPSWTRLVELRAETENDTGLSAKRDALLVAAARRNEAVRPSKDNDAWARKFGERRVAFSLVHYAAEAEPLAFLFSALLMKTPSNFCELDGASGTPLPGNRSWRLEDGTYDEASAPAAATFYSVSAAAPHTRGLRLGQRLLFSGASRLAAAVPTLREFATLSPVPGFSEWLFNTVKTKGDGRDALEHSLSTDEAASMAAPAGARSKAAAASLRPWVADAARAQAASPPARALTARALRHYLISAGGSKPLCPVAAFHLSNGACLGRICGAADASAEGALRSGGFCVNYVYSREGLAGLAATATDGMEAWIADSRAVLKAQNPDVVWRS
jgi:hypothetical protein